MIKNKDKNKGHTKEFRSDDPTSFLSHPEQQKSMLLDTIDDAKVKPKKKVMEPIEIPEIISVPRRQPIKKTEVIESYNTGPQIPIGLSQRFTQDRLREGQILKQLDREMAIESKNDQTTNEEDKND